MIDIYILDHLANPVISSPDSYSILPIMVRTVLAMPSCLEPAD